jgi:pyridoxal phosphate enzyme (YggS family)
MPPFPDPTTAIADKLAAIGARIARAAQEAGRDPQDVTLVAVSKTHPATAIAAAIAAGQLCFGENRVQEAASKFPALRPAHARLRLHLIGALQTNKTEDAIRLADTIESLDRPRLADAIAAAAERVGRLPELFIQVNIGDEPQKAGIPTRDADSFIRACRGRFGENLRGLMCIPPAQADPTPFFARLAALRAEHGLPCLSMGMSGDFERAVAAGATHVRIGSAIFGER